MSRATLDSAAFWAMSSSARESRSPGYGTRDALVDSESNAHVDKDVARRVKTIADRVNPILGVWAAGGIDKQLAGTLVEKISILVSGVALGIEAARNGWAIALHPLDAVATAGLYDACRWPQRRHFKNNVQHDQRCNE